MNAVKLKQLEIHPDNSGVIIFVDKKSVSLQLRN